MNYVSIPSDQLIWLSPDLQHTLRLFDRYRNPFTGQVEHEIRDRDLEIMRSRFPELAGHRRRYPVDTLAQPRMLTIDIGPVATQVFASSRK